MGKESSFDIVSEVNLQEIDNAVNQTTKEMMTRFDFKGSKSSVAYQREENKILIVADDEMKLRNVKDILTTRLAKRSVSMKALSFQPEEKAFDGMVRQTGEILQGIAAEKAKLIVKLIKDTKLKVQASIQEDKVRVTGKQKDDLQHIMQVLRAQNLDIPIQFVNFREH